MLADIPCVGVGKKLYHVDGLQKDAEHKRKVSHTHQHVTVPHVLHYVSCINRRGERGGKEPGIFSESMQERRVRFLFTVLAYGPGDLWSSIHV